MVMKRLKPSIPNRYCHCNEPLDPHRLELTKKLRSLFPNQASDDTQTLLQMNRRRTSAEGIHPLLFFFLNCGLGKLNVLLECGMGRQTL